MKGGTLSDILTPFDGGIRLTVRAKPGTPRARALKIVDIGDGKRAIEVSVAADAREGRANKALIERLAKELRVAKKQIEIKSGATGRLKVIEICGNSEILARRLIQICRFE